MESWGGGWAGAQGGELEGRDPRRPPAKAVMGTTAEARGFLQEEAAPRPCAPEERGSLNLRSGSQIPREGGGSRPE